MIEKVFFISFSPCGGTEKVSEALGRDIDLPQEAVNITLSRNRKEDLVFSGGDLVFLAFPVYGGRMPRFFPDFIAKLHGNDTPVVLVAIYGNRAHEGAFLDMDAPVRAGGFRPVAAVAAIAQHSSFPLSAAGRPDGDDAETLAAFGRRALAKAQASGAAVALPGEYPAWSIPPGTAPPLFIRADTDACISCGACVRNCPNDAIPSDAPHETMRERCIVCAACVKRCPQKARSLALRDAEVKAEIAKHRDAMLSRKEPALFI